jgi:glucose/arabinose dehydrogenase
MRNCFVFVTLSFWRRVIGSVLLLLISIGLAGCFTLTNSNGGGQFVRFQGARRVSADDVALPPGYTIAPIAVGLNFPTGVCFDDHGGVYITEAGDSQRLPRLLEVNLDGTTRAIASGENPPWNGVDYFDGNFYVAESGRLLKISPEGDVVPLLSNLPSAGEYHTNGPLVSVGGYLYFGQGSATNSGVVGLDDDALGWTRSARRFHDIPGGDIKLSGVNVQTSDPTSPGNPAVTGAFSPFGEPTAPGEVAPGQVPCTGAVMRVALAGGAPELVAWGFRNPVGLAFDGDGQLFVTEQSYEDRGSRPVSGCGDLVCAVKTGVWFGWPDYWADQALTRSRQFAAVGKPAPQALLMEYPNIPPKPAAILAMHAGASGMDFSRNGAFGHSGEAFIAEFGDLAPWAGKLMAPVGFDVVRVDTKTGVSHVFAANRGDATGPASRLGTGGLERPIAARFDPSGTALYVVDYGVVTVGDLPRPHEGTGVLWKITRKTGP